MTNEDYTTEAKDKKKRATKLIDYINYIIGHV